jgi:hypothetical protein
MNIEAIKSIFKTVAWSRSRNRRNNNEPEGDPERVCSISRLGRQRVRPREKLLEIYVPVTKQVR